MSRLRGAVARALRRVEPPARVVDWAIAACVAFEVASGLYSFTRGTPSGAWVFWLHSTVGLTLAALVGFKLWRVRRRVTSTASWDRFTPLSVLQAAVTLAALATGAFWVLGGNVPILAWTTLNLHVGLGLLLVPLVLYHLRGRYHSPRDVDPDRRATLKVGALLLAGTVAWRASEAADRALGGASRRFTGSKPTGDLYDTETEGGGFPVTSWVADDPDPVDPDSWTLSVRGLVGEELDLGYDDLGGGMDGGGAPAGPDAELEATLDCTSGWYTHQRWGGVRVGDLLDAAGVEDGARYVRFTSVTGYRWSLPVEEAADALLATHVRDRPLSHGHGAPARLVAPGRRGFQWVKWVESVEVRERGDPMQWLVTLVSGFD
ncbi:molybdopterin-dependent oxidoreductase [Halobaculum magnesiiphilum]|uniref:Molybdopterin-dependent oxidoreductase n=1 Tax=Halobaculum magnesiiphilum TaxID=1017351 RepID=A0A8T8WAG9_9EURY|nr:molybdopterin-dependent oxidoreductase [Halobaculum magnesiiphilum]QZP36840.1 molybdopterin-dependent oxidoreductase [Halobaculum magnesiiphilum]